MANKKSKKILEKQKLRKHTEIIIDINANL